jgi:ribonuclease P protein component
MRAARLRRNADIAMVRSHGRTIQHALFSLRAYPNDQGQVRLAVSAPGVIGSAVARNRVRRRLREALRRALADEMGLSGQDLLVVARSAAASAPPADLAAAARATIAKLAARSG